MCDLIPPNHQTTNQHPRLIHLDTCCCLFPGNLSYPPQSYPPRKKALLRDYEPLVSLKTALLGAYFLGGWHWGSYLKFPCLLLFTIQATGSEGPFFEDVGKINAKLGMLQNCRAKLSSLLGCPRKFVNG